jgi:hypothetical protein
VNFDLMRPTKSQPWQGKRGKENREKLCSTRVFIAWKFSPIKKRYLAKHFHGSTLRGSDSMIKYKERKKETSKSVHAAPRHNPRKVTVENVYKLQIIFSFHSSLTTDSTLIRSKAATEE